MYQVFAGGLEALVQSSSSAANVDDYQSVVAYHSHLISSTHQQLSKFRSAALTSLTALVEQQSPKDDLAPFFMFDCVSNVLGLASRVLPEYQHDTDVLDTGVVAQCFKCALSLINAVKRHKSSSLGCAGGGVGFAQRMNILGQLMPYVSLFESVLRRNISHRIQEDAVSCLLPIAAPRGATLDVSLLGGYHPYQVEKTLLLDCSREEWGCQRKQITKLGLIAALFEVAIGSNSSSTSKLQQLACHALNMFALSEETARSVYSVSLTNFDAIKKNAGICEEHGKVVRISGGGNGNGATFEILNLLHRLIACQTGESTVGGHPSCLANLEGFAGVALVLIRSRSRSRSGGQQRLLGSAAAILGAVLQHASNNDNGTGNCDSNAFHSVLHHQGLGTDAGGALLAIFEEVVAFLEECISAEQKSQPADNAVVDNNESPGGESFDMDLAIEGAITSLSSIASLPQLANLVVPLQLKKTTTDMLAALLGSCRGSFVYGKKVAFLCCHTLASLKYELPSSIMERLVHIIVDLDQHPDMVSAAALALTETAKISSKTANAVISVEVVVDALCIIFSL